MNTNKTRILPDWLVFAWAFAVGLSQARGGDRDGEAGRAANPALQRVVEAWQRRQDRVRSLRFTWTQHSFTPAEWREYLQRKSPPAIRRARLPEFRDSGEKLKDLQTERTMTFVIDGCRTRFERRGRAPTGWPNNELHDRRSVRVFDGAKHVILDRRYHLDGAAVPHATISSFNQELSAGTLMPLICHYRMLNRDMQLM